MLLKRVQKNDWVHCLLWIPIFCTAVWACADTFVFMVYLLKSVDHLNTQREFILLPFFTSFSILYKECWESNYKRKMELLILFCSHSQILEVRFHLGCCFLCDAQWAQRASSIHHFCQLWFVEWAASLIVVENTLWFCAWWHVVALRVIPVGIDEEKPMNSHICQVSESQPLLLLI